MNTGLMLSHDFPEIAKDLSPRDASLYALGVGLGDDPLDRAQLKYLYEQHPGFCAVPTQPVTMGFFRWVLTPEFGIDVTRVVHGAERLTLHGPIPTSGRILAKLRILGIEDKGESRGAVVSSRRDIRLEGHDTPFATIETLTFCRGDGGSGTIGEPLQLATPLPDREPGTRCSVEIPGNAALIYRLSGDENPLHIDPDYAARAGFPKPILHGLCTFAAVTRTIWSVPSPARDLYQVGCRFSGVVYPGDTLDVEQWQSADGISFQAKVGTRVVVTQGWASFSSAGAPGGPVK